MVAGIIAEFNPMHEGHKYLIDKTKNELGADKIIAVMSGSYAQRGIPAILDKLLRTKAALLAGADVVIELPATASLGSAEYFALSSVSVLNSTNVVDVLSFGSESGDLALLTEAARLLKLESPDFKFLLKSLVSSGLTYPKAAAKALAETNTECSALLRSPNNTLAIEYLKALDRTSSSIRPYTVSRKGAGYNSKDFNVGEDVYPSATYLRKNLLDNNHLTFFSNISNDMQSSLLDAGICHDRIPFIDCDDFTPPLMYRLSMSSRDELCSIADINIDFINRLLNTYSGRTFSEIAHAMHSKNITLARVQRILFHIILDIRKEDMEKLKSGIEYIHVLGIRKNSSLLLKDIIASASVPVVCRYRDYDRLDASAKASFDKDMRSYELYKEIYLRKYPDEKYKPARDLSGLVIV